MIHGVFGKLGSGKGLFVMKIIYDELVTGFRDVVTNVPVRVVPWVNGQCVPQIGLRSYILAETGLADFEIDEMLKRLLVIEDIEKGADLFMHRRDGNTGDWFKLESTHPDDKGRPSRFDAEPIKERRCAPVLVVTDEAWQFYPNNGGWSRSPLLPFYGRQQRKLRDEWFIVTQHPDDVDAVIWKIAQDFRVCRNHGMERMGIFRQPSMFRVITYLTNPSKGNAIRSHESYLTLPKKLAQCYDTTAGVGITGGFAGDSNQRKKGLHVAWLLVAVVLFVVLLACVPWGIRKFSSGFFMRTLSGGRLDSSGHSVPSHVPRAGGSNAVPSQFGTASEKQSVQGTNQSDVFCTGYFFFPGKGPQAYLSDGSEVSPPDLQLVAKNFIVVSGRKIKVQFQRPEYVFQPPPQYEQPPALPDRPVNDAQVIVIGQNHRQPPPRLGGIESMQSQFRQ